MYKTKLLFWIVCVCVSLFLMLCNYRSSSPISSNASLCTESLPFRKNTPGLEASFSLIFFRNENESAVTCNGTSLSVCIWVAA